jgi:hypothetical protein
MFSSTLFRNKHKLEDKKGIYVIWFEPIIIHVKITVICDTASLIPKFSVLIALILIK